LKNGSNQRDAKWTQSIAVGDKEFVMQTKAKLGAKAMGRRASKNNESYELIPTGADRCKARMGPYLFPTVIRTPPPIRWMKIRIATDGWMAKRILTITVGWTREKTIPINPA